MKELIRFKFVLMCMILMSGTLTAQNKPISGKVTDAGGLPLPGVTVIVKETSNGTVTDSNGSFSLQVSNEESVLVFSFIGFAQQEVRVGNQSTINVTLREDILQLDEVQVIGYGTQKKATVTGAISTVSNDELIKTAAPNVATVLAGRMTGVATVQMDGTPGADNPSIYIRGVGSLTDGRSQPLVLVDGVERPFTQLDPNEIDDITILKDASATAVFGVRGANGVLLITTRRGQAGKPKITVSSRYGIQQPTRMLETVGSYDWYRFNNQMNINDGLEPMYSDEFLERVKSGDNPLLYIDNKQSDYILRKAAPLHQHNFNISGGSEKARYFVSLGYMDQGGFFKQISPDYDNTYNYKRFNYRANLDLDITPTTLAKINLGGIYGKRNEPNQGNESIWVSLFKALPMGTPGIIDGKFILRNEIYTQQATNPSVIRDLWNTGHTLYYQNSLNFDLELTQDLSFVTKGMGVSVKGSYNNNYGTSKTWTLNREQYVPWRLGDLQGIPEDDPNFDETVVYEVRGSNTSLRYEDSYAGYDRDWYLEAKLNYARSFGNHNVTGLVLYNRLRNYYPAAPRYIPRSYLGWVGRITYDWNTRYMVDVNMGYNGSENFAPGKRYGLFPSFSAGWVVSEENFWQGIKPFIDYLKLRGSYGMVGNDVGISRYMYIPGAWNPEHGSYDFAFVPNPIPGAAEGIASNPIVTWETATKQNYGFDMTIASRLNVNFDYFFENREDILISRNTAPQIIAFQLPNVNFGRVKNRGFEIALEWRGGQRSGFSYTINPTLSFARNKIIEMDEIEPVHAYQKQTGGPTGRVLAMQFDRFFSEDDFSEDGSLKEGIPSPPANVRPGDPLFIDMNDDGTLDNYDRVWLGYGSRPEYVSGLNIGLNYKNLALTANLRGTFNATWYEGNKLLREPFGSSGDSYLLQYLADNSWTPETSETATLPLISNTSRTYSYQPSSLYIWDASYIRLQNIQVSYTFSNDALLNRLGAQGLQVYANGTNVFTFDHIKYFDPETRAGFTHPLLKNYAVGLRINF